MCAGGASSKKRKDYDRPSRHRTVGSVSAWRVSGVPSSASRSTEVCLGSDSVLATVFTASQLSPKERNSFHCLDRSLKGHERT